MSRAFQREPGMRWMLPDDASRQGRLERFFAGTLRWLYLPLGGTDVAVGDNGIAAGAVWCPPGRWKTPAWRAILVAPTMIRALGRQARAGQRVMESLEKHHPTEPHWYLAALGTDPAAQGKGAAAVLLRSRLALCDAAGEAAYLETADETNVTIYQRFGFRSIHQIAMPDGAPSQCGMWRDPDPT
jgi:GNAT superfamily N-acetyltransferase